MAGFKHVIGTLWHVSDDIGAQIAGDVYAGLMSGGDVAATLHDAIARVREQFPRSPTLWAAHIHSGP
jgi:CHAT domain-containing protein